MMEFSIFAPPASAWSFFVAVCLLFFSSRLFPKRIPQDPPEPGERGLERRRIAANARANDLLTAKLPDTAAVARTVLEGCEAAAHEHLILEAEITTINNLRQSDGRIRAIAEQALHGANLGIRGAQAGLLYTVFADAEGFDPDLLVRPGMNSHNFSRDALLNARDAITRVYSCVDQLEKLGIWAKFRRLLRLAVSFCTRQAWGKYDLEKACDIAMQVIRDLADLFDQEDVLRESLALETLAKMDLEPPVLINRLTEIVAQASELKSTPHDFSYPALVMKLLGARAPLAELPASTWVFEWTSHLLLLEAWLYSFAASAAIEKLDAFRAKTFLSSARAAAAASRWDAAESKYLRRKVLRGIGQLRMQRTLLDWSNPPSRTHYKKWYLALSRHLTHLDGKT